MATVTVETVNPAPKLRGEAALVFLTRLSRFLSDLWGADKVYRALAYGCRALSFYLRRLSATTALAQRVASVGSALSQTRYAVRFWGTIDSLQDLVDVFVSIQRGTLQWSSHDTLLRVGAAMSMLIYHPLEHAYWLDAVTPGLLPSGWPDALSLWSCRFWLAWCVLSILQELRALASLTKRMALLGTERGASAADASETEQFRDPITELKDLLSQRARSQLRLSVLFADTVLAAHWSLPSGLPRIHDGHIGLLGLYGALVGGFLKWTAMSSIGLGSTAHRVTFP